MKKLHLFVLCSIFSLTISAQKVYFVYIQTENEQRFFVKLDKKTIHSSQAGYVILPKLLDSTYSFSIGFPQNQFAEQRFTVVVNKKDHGFLLKNFPEKGWGLLDLQSQDVNMAINAAVINSSETVSVTPFTEILSKATDDPSLKDKVVPQNDPFGQKKQEIIPAVSTDTIVAAVVPAVNTVTVAPDADPEQPSGKKKKGKNRKSTETKVDKSTDEKLAKDPITTPEVKLEEGNATIKDTVATAAAIDVKAETNTDKKVENTAIIKDTIVTETKNETKAEAKDTVRVIEDKKEQKAEPVAEKNEPVVQTPEIKPVAVNEAKAEISPEIKKENKTADESSDKKREEKDADDEMKESKKQSKKKGDKYKKSEVKKYAESSTTEGFGLVFVDKSEDGKDTIRLTIPNPKPVVHAATEEPKQEKKFLELNVDDGKTTSTVKTEIATNPSLNTTSKAKVACGDLASDEEFARLRKKMAGEVENKMLGEAKKFFKSKCFTTRQIQVLGRLFETDEARYNFFDEAYNHVSDPESFPVLQSDLQDPYYSGRFKAMLRN